MRHRRDEALNNRAELRRADGGDVTEERNKRCLMAEDKDCVAIVGFANAIGVISGSIATAEPIYAAAPSSRTVVGGGAERPNAEQRRAAAGGSAAVGARATSDGRIVERWRDGGERTTLVVGSGKRRDNRRAPSHPDGAAPKGGGGAGEGRGGRGHQNSLDDSIDLAQQPCGAGRWGQCVDQNRVGNRLRQWCQRVRTRRAGAAAVGGG